MSTIRWQLTGTTRDLIIHVHVGEADRQAIQTTSSIRRAFFSKFIPVMMTANVRLPTSGTIFRQEIPWKLLMSVP